jgi:hypothetical protein
MKSYGLDLQNSDINSKAEQIESGNSFPIDAQQGFIFFLTEIHDGKAPGLYSFDGSEWVISGDISSVAAGHGLVGGGASGDVSLSLDVGVVEEIAQTQIQISMQEVPDPIAMALIFGS